MKKRQAIALMLLGMIAFTHVGAAVDTPTTKYEKAQVMPKLECEKYSDVMPGKTFVVSAVNNIPFVTIDEETKTTTLVTECKPCPVGVVTTTSDLPLDVGWC